MREGDYSFKVELPAFESRFGGYDFLLVLNALSKHIGWSGDVEAYYPDGVGILKDLRAASILHKDGSRIFVEHIKHDPEHGIDSYRISGLPKEISTHDFESGLRQRFLSYLESVEAKVAPQYLAETDSNPVLPICPAPAAAPSDLEALVR